MTDDNADEGSEDPPNEDEEDELRPARKSVLEAREKSREEQLKQLEQWRQEATESRQDRKVRVAEGDDVVITNDSESIQEAKRRGELSEPAHDTELIEQLDEEDEPADEDDSGQ